jgi:hypothetical protein
MQSVPVLRFYCARVRFGIRNAQRQGEPWSLLFVSIRGTSTRFISLSCMQIADPQCLDSNFQWQHLQAFIANVPIPLCYLRLL